MQQSLKNNKQEPPLSVTTISEKADFIKLDKIYQDNFGESSVPTDVLFGWWITAPSGLIQLVRGSEVVGGISVWPITERTYNRFRGGTLRERELTPENLSPTVESGFFYASEIAIRGDERKQIESLITLVIGSIDLLIATHSFPLKILALGYSKEGENLMKRLGFKKLLEASDVSDSQPLYELHARDKQQLCGLRSRFQKIAQILVSRRKDDTPNKS